MAVPGFGTDPLTCGTSSSKGGPSTGASSFGLSTTGDKPAFPQPLNVTSLRPHKASSSRGRHRQRGSSSRSCSSASSSMSVKGGLAGKSEDGESSGISDASEVSAPTSRCGSQASRSIASRDGASSTKSVKFEGLSIQHQVPDTNFNQAREDLRGRLKMLKERKVKHENEKREAEERRAALAALPRIIQL
eukprot:TRINITY_DN5472_c0_g1_i2.p2 TRINITY_DN5472_c0_g1~~TRINITY_DN5472_c0_g1_i2.p2  ORF type:complete len:190 (-),score=19.39 TRINITY_DN5472_c0_g1_i2:327-896(-)